MVHLDEDGVLGDETRGALRALTTIGDAIGIASIRIGRAEESALDPMDAQAVKELQRDHGLHTDGAIGSKTRQALRWCSEHLLAVDVGSPESVRAFQNRHGLTSDGVVGRATQAAMKAARATREATGRDASHRYGEAIRYAAAASGPTSIPLTRHPSGPFSNGMD